MCPPTYFDVVYAINDWMDPAAPVDTALAGRQWERLRQTYLDLGAEVELIEPVPGLPDMVFVCDSAVVVDRVAMGARYRSPHRAPEADHVLDWLRAHDYLGPTRPRYVNEGEGDFLVVGQTVLAGTGFRTDERAHLELGAHLCREVVTLRLVDPRFYHLNTALGVLDDHTIAYLPDAFDDRSRAELRRRYPDAIIADRGDAEWLGLNLVSDGLHVVLPGQARGLIDAVTAAGFEPVPLDFSEFRKSGGGIKCVTLELRD
jgi:N-dimethylarginine dimethylaminohydrolase